MDSRLTPSPNISQSASEPILASNIELIHEAIVGDPSSLDSLKMQLAAPHADDKVQGLLYDALEIALATWHLGRGYSAVKQLYLEFPRGDYESQVLYQIGSSNWMDMVLATAEDSLKDPDARLQLIPSDIELILNGRSTPFQRGRLFEIAYQHVEKSNVFYSRHFATISDLLTDKQIIELVGSALSSGEASPLDLAREIKFAKVLAHRLGKTHLSGYRDFSPQELLRLSADDLPEEVLHLLTWAKSELARFQAKSI